MYEVIVINDGVKTTIHSPNANDLKLSSGVVKKEINLIDSFDFSFHMANPGFQQIKPLRTLISVFNTKTRQYEFEGRVLGPSKHMDNSGLHRNSYICEGELGYLHDSVQQHLEFRGTPQELFTKIIAYHNAQVESYKQFQVGRITVTNSTNNLYLYLSAEKDTFDTIKEKLLDKLGGELQIRKINGVRFLDLLNRVGEEKNTEIRIAKNLINMSCDIDPTQVVTRLTPLGAQLKSEDEGATDASQARLTIGGVNGGINYLDDPKLIKEFGIQGRSVTWNDVTIASNLLSKGKEWLATQKTISTQYKLSAVDLYLIGLDIDSFKEGNSYPVINPVMGINERLRIIGKSVDINNPQNASLTIGDKIKTLNQYQTDLNKSTQRVGELQYTVSQLNTQVSSLTTSLSDAEKELQTLTKAVEKADLQGVITSVTNLKETLKKVEVDIQNLPTNEAMLEIKTTVQENTNAILLITKKIEEIEKSMKTYDTSISKLQGELKSLTERVITLEGTGGV
ncbi:lysin [Bacillus cereus]|nr:lysin [Bacillus cereus]